MSPNWWRGNDTLEELAAGLVLILLAWLYAA